MGNVASTYLKCSSPDERKVLDETLSTMSAFLTLRRHKAEARSLLDTYAVDEIILRQVEVWKNEEDAEVSVIDDTASEEDYAMSIVPTEVTSFSVATRLASNLYSQAVPRNNRWSTGSKQRGGIKDTAQEPQQRSSDGVNSAQIYPNDKFLMCGLRACSYFGSPRQDRMPHSHLQTRYDILHLKSEYLVFFHVVIRTNAPFNLHTLLSSFIFR